tara:strand:- start:72 stop:389 length:318 start_codon:yes stop_codon:yes gene_type:complete
MGSKDSSATEKVLVKAWAKAHGFSLVETSTVSAEIETPVIEALAPSIEAKTSGILAELVSKGLLVKQSGFRTVDKAGFMKLREYAQAKGLKIDTQSVIVSIAPAI